MPLLSVQGLKLYYASVEGAVRAVDDVSYAVEEGEALGVVGESGCGKTSLALALIRLLPSNVHTYEGSLILEGMNLRELSEDDYRRKVRWRKISMVFQGAMNSLCPVMKVGHQIAEPMIVAGIAEKHEAIVRAKHLMSMVGLSEYVFDRYPHELSCGMKQRAIIAMSLIMNPQLLILDEPTSALDVSVQAQIINLLKRLKRDLSLSLIFITHDIALVSDICDRIAVMYAGEIVELGDADDLLTIPKHPYARKLIASVPRLREDFEPEFVPGSPPNLANPPSGCRFHPRCPYAFDPCQFQEPLLIRVHERRDVRCWLYVGKHD